MSRTSTRFWLGGLPTLGVIAACLACSTAEHGVPIETRPWFEGSWTRPAFPGADPYQTDLTIERGLVTMDAIDAGGRLVSRVSGHVAGPQFLQLDDGRQLQVAALPDGGLRLIDEARRLALDFHRVVYGGGPVPAPLPSHPHGGACDPWLVGTWFAQTNTRGGIVDLVLTIDPAGVAHQTSTNRRTGEQLHLHGQVVEAAGVIEYEHGVALQFSRRSHTLETYDPRDGRQIAWNRQGGSPPPHPAPSLVPAPVPAPRPAQPAESWWIDSLPSNPVCSGQLDFFPEGAVQLLLVNRQTGAKEVWTGVLRGQEAQFQNGLSMAVARDANTLKSHDDRNGSLRWRRR